MTGDSITDLLKPRSEVNAVEHVEPATRAESASADYVAFSHGRVGRRPQMMISFRRSSGQVAVFPYSLLRQILSSNPDTGFTMAFGGTSVRIEGEGLARLFQYVCEHRAVEIVESDRPRIIPTSSCVVTVVEVDATSASSVWSGSNFNAAKRTHHKD